MKRPAIPFLGFDARRGVWRWRPPPALRAHFASRVLGAERKDAETEALRLNREVAAWRRDHPAAAAASGKARAPRRTVAALIEAYRASPDWRALAPSTRVAYACELDRLHRTFGARLVAAVRPRDVDEWLDEMRERAPDAARHLGARARALWTWGQRKGLAPAANPWSRARLGAGAQRDVYCDLDGLRALVAAADAEGRPSLGTAAIIGFCAIARITDVLRLTEAQITRAGPGAPARLVYLQNKTRNRHVRAGQRRRAPIDVVCPPAILRRLITHPPRPTPSGLLCAREERRPPRPNESGGGRRPQGQWSEREASRAWLRIAARAAAATGNAGLRAVQLRDMRRSGFVHALLSGVPVGEIASLSGHSYKTIHEMAEHYAPRTRAAADAVVRRMQVEI